MYHRGQMIVVRTWPASSGRGRRAGSNGWPGGRRSNFLLRARHGAEVGWFPTFTMGEDVALALELQCRGHISCYLHECLAVGEVPTGIRAICMQKSRSLPISISVSHHHDHHRHCHRYHHHHHLYHPFSIIVCGPRHRSFPRDGVPQKQGGRPAVDVVNYSWPDLSSQTSGCLATTFERACSLHASQHRVRVPL